MATGAASPPTSVPVSPRFEWSKIGSDWEADGTTVVSSGMLAEERYAVGSKLVREGKVTFTYTINKVFYPDAHLFVGVAQITDDPERATTWAFNGPTGNLYVGKQLNEHGEEKRKVRLHTEEEGYLVGKQEGAVIECIVDMDEKKLAFAVNGQDPIDCGITLPDVGVRPWVFLYHEGDSVTIEEVC